MGCRLLSKDFTFACASNRSIERKKLQIMSTLWTAQSVLALNRGRARRAIRQIEPIGEVLVNSTLDESTKEGANETNDFNRVPRGRPREHVGSRPYEPVSACRDDDIHSFNRHGFHASRGRLGISVG